MRKRTGQMKQLLAVSILGAITSFAALAQSVATTISEGSGSYSRNTTVTGAYGKTARYQDNRTWGNGVYTNSRSYTGVNGGTRTDIRTRSGGVVTNTFTGRHGNTQTYSHPAHWRR